MQRRLIPLVLFSVWIGFTREATAERNYRLSIVARVGDTIAGQTITDMNSMSGISDAGPVFRGIYDGGRGIFTPNEALILDGAVIDGVTISLWYPSGTSISPDGQNLAFLSTTPTGTALFTLKDGLIAESGDVIDGRTINEFTFSPSLNNVGDISFHANTPGGSAYFLNHSLVVAEGDVYPSGTVAYPGFPSTSPDGSVGVYGAIFDNFTLGTYYLDGTPIVLPGDVVDGVQLVQGVFVSPPNNAGDLLMIGQVPGPPPVPELPQFSKLGVFLNDQLVVQAPHVVDGLTMNSLGATPNINEYGDIVLHGVFFGNNEIDGVVTPEDIIAIEGDQVEGQTIIDIIRWGGTNGTRRLNNRGQVVFDGYLEDGTRAVFLADPRGIDEEFAVLPSVVTAPGEFEFHDVRSGDWFDPDIVEGYEYTMDSEDLFTRIVDFPTGFSDEFIVSVDGDVLGEFGPGESVDFVALLGAGVSAFTVSNITPLVDPEDLYGFPLRIEFDSLRASFSMSAITVPIPADFDNDGDVDGDDFLTWQAAFGVNDDGDADGDGDTDGDDFLIWQSNFGSGAASATAPEPSSICIVFTSLFIAICIATRRINAG